MKNLKSTPISNFNYFRPSFAVDGVVFSMIENELNVLLIKRGAIDRNGKKRPFFGYWGFPGGFMRSQETTTAAVTRELLEEAGLDLIKKKINPYQLNVYSDPFRDSYNFDKNNEPGKHKQTISQAFLIILPRSYQPKPGTDSVEAKFFKVRDVIKGDIEYSKLAFDHNKILEDALIFLNEKLTYSTIALDFCDPQFTIADIRYVYQSVWSIFDKDVVIELGNFQNKILKQTNDDANALISPLPPDKQKLRKQPGKGAPAKLFKLNSKTTYLSHMMQPPKKR